MDARSGIPTLTASRLTERIRLGGVIAGLLATLLPPTIALLLQLGQASLRDVLSVLLPLTISAIGWAQPRWTLRVALSSIGAYAYVVAVVLLDTSAGITWPPVASSTFAASVVVISGTAGLWGLLGIAASAALCALGVMIEPVSTFNISVDFLGGWITPLVSIGLGLSFFIVLRIWDERALAFDHYLGVVRAAHRAAIEEDEAAGARRRIDRRIHETVLNTLNAITVSEDTDSIRKQCRIDLDTLTASVSETAHLLSAIIDDCAARVPEIRVHRDLPGDLDIADEQVRSVLTDALTELLRNVERHSGVRDAAVHVQFSGDGVVVTVEDAGRGMAEGEAARFGVRHTLVTSLRGIGGEVTWTAVAPHGTRAEMRLPLRPRTEPPRVPASSDFLLDSTRARLALVPTLWIGLIAVPVAALSFTRPWTIVLGYVLLMGFAAALIIRWNTADRRVLSLATMATALLTIALAAASQDGCASAIPFHWVIFAAAGSFALIALAQRTSIARAATATIGIVASTLLAFSSPATCRLDAVDAALENAAWVAIIVSVVTALTTQVDRYRAAADQEWLDAVRLRARTLASQGAAERWATARESVDSLLRAIAVGEMDPVDPQTKERARSIQARLRSLLEVGQLRDPSARRAWEDFLSLCANQRSSVLIDVLDAQHLPPGSQEFTDLGTLVQSSAGAPIVISLLADTMLVRAHRVQIELLRSDRWSVLEVSDKQDWTLECASAGSRATQVAVS